MARIKIDLPDSFLFKCAIPIRITDINYGDHVGNDTVLSLIHEARVQFLKHLGYSEMQMEGVGMIMADAAIEFKSEMFYSDIVLASVAVGEISKIGFDLFYKLEKEKDGKNLLVVAAKTGMICYDYGRKRIVAVPETAREKLGIGGMGIS